MDLTQGPPGTRVRVSGDGFSADAELAIWFAGNGEVAQAMADGAGAFATTFTVPSDASVGEHAVSVETSGMSGDAVATFEVTAQGSPPPAEQPNQPCLAEVGLDPQAGPPGTETTFSGKNLPPDQIIRFSAALYGEGEERSRVWNDIGPPVTVSPSGSFSAKLTVPKDVPESPPKGVVAIRAHLSVLTDACNDEQLDEEFVITVAQDPSPKRKPSKPPIDPTHRYVAAEQTFETPYAHGVGGLFTEPTDLPNIPQGAYSIGQLHLISTGPILTKVIEFGWIVHPGVWNDNRPYLFIALRFVNTSGVPIQPELPRCLIGVPPSKDNPSCPPDVYVQQSQTIKPGDPVGATQGPIMYHVGYDAPNKRWGIQYGDEWVGFVKESHFGSAGFAKGHVVEWQGEVVYETDPCVPMGNGQHAKDASSASVADMFYETMRDGQSLRVPAEASLTVDDARFWSAGNESTNGSGIKGFHYGGPGDCGTAR